MKEVTKSMISLSWGMSLFGAKQAADLLTRSQSPGSLARVADSARQELDEGFFGTLFKMGDQLQRGAVDLAFGAFSLQTFDPGRWMQMASQAMPSAAPTPGGGAAGGEPGGPPLNLLAVALAGIGQVANPPKGWGLDTAPLPSSAVDPERDLWPEAAA